MAVKRKKTVEPRYVVNMSVHAWDLAKAGSAMTVQIREHGKLLGTIEIGQGSFRWKPAHGKLGFKPIRWDTLAGYLNEHY